ncbi:MAG: membrane protein insertion efficiency factor YidD [Nakamurella sp.]
MTNKGNIRRRTSPAAWLLVAPIRFYQKFVTPYTPASCRYYPTCSEYAVRSLRAHGAIKGTILTVWRLLRCNPWSSGGVDHIPERGHWRSPVLAAADGDSDVDVDTSSAFGTGCGSDLGTGSGTEHVTHFMVANDACGSAGEDVIHAVSGVHTCGSAICDTDETAQPSAGAPNAGRVAA